MSCIIPPAQCNLPVPRRAGFAPADAAGPVAAGPQLPEHFWRQHLTVENGSHSVRDKTLGEDRSQTHVGCTPRVVAALRNGLLALLRPRAWANSADALRPYGASP